MDVGIMVGIVVGSVVGSVVGIVVGMVNGRYVVGIEGMFGNVVGIGRDDIDGIWVIGILGNEGILNGMFEGMFWRRWRAAAMLVGVVENEISATRRASAKQGLRAVAIEVYAKRSGGILGN
ncbi:hypothetical protein RHMOL_Rhmol02G0237500 [Rhododendron molle]|uniref:Uncharacterized protein n=1 Tax=Rhododendron molle TaxID=49168 RepID=A0ACC0PV27_RHOML|nr:hypothetical protein RHMOL_Rhmol02G0237500 [Rhododendron molle]